MILCVIQATLAIYCYIVLVLFEKAIDFGKDVTTKRKCCIFINITILMYLCMYIFITQIFNIFFNILN